MVFNGYERLRSAGLLLVKRLEGIFKTDDKRSLVRAFTCHRVGGYEMNYPQQSFWRLIGLFSMTRRSIKEILK